LSGRTLSLDEAADKPGVSKSTASGAYRDLGEKGFLVKTSDGNFIRGHATTWRLTFRNAGKGQLPTDEWKGRIKPPGAPKKRKPWGGSKAKARELIRQVAAEKTLSGTENEPVA
ncbi:MAG: hypothetical protein DLM68_05860, partial [Hyphomicrobiales bacterium]